MNPFIFPSVYEEFRNKSFKSMELLETYVFNDNELTFYYVNPFKIRKIVVTRSSFDLVSEDFKKFIQKNNGVAFGGYIDGEQRYVSEISSLICGISTKKCYPNLSFLKLSDAEDYFHNRVTFG